MQRLNSFRPPLQKHYQSGKNKQPARRAARRPTHSSGGGTGSPCGASSTSNSARRCRAPQRRAGQGQPKSGRKATIPFIPFLTAQGACLRRRGTFDKPTRRESKFGRPLWLGCARLDECAMLRFCRVQDRRWWRSSCSRCCPPPARPIAPCSPLSCRPLASTEAFCKSRVDITSQHDAVDVNTAR